MRELGKHRTVVRKETKRKLASRVDDPDRKWRMACSCGITPSYHATAVAADAAAVAHLTVKTGVVLHD